MSPARLQYLLHCYCIRSPYDQYLEKDWHEFLLSEKVIEPDDNQPFTGEPMIFRTTEKGKFWVEAILSVPMPISRWEIPDLTKEQVK
jgi:hypothetical protein